MEDFNANIGASTDDCTATATAIFLTANDLEVGKNGSDVASNAGFRWLGVSVPSGATIESAYIKFTSNRANFGTVNTELEGEAADNPITFSTLVDYNGRSRTVEKVSWPNVGSWSDGVQYDTPDLSSIIQEIINRPGWASGNALVLFWNDDGSSAYISRHPKAYDLSPSLSAELYITYSVVEATRSKILLTGIGH